MVPYEKCPRYSSCNVNICPLDPDRRLRTRLADEPHCTMAKSIRRRIGADWLDVLPLGGLTAREKNGEQRWAALTSSEKAAEKARLGRLRANLLGVSELQPMAVDKSTIDSGETEIPM